MFEEMLYLQPQPGSDGNHPEWPTTPEAHTHAPAEREKRRMLQPFMSSRTVTEVRVCCTFGEGSFSIIVRRERGVGLPIGESGMKEDQYPYRILFSTPFTTASRQCSAP